MGLMLDQMKIRLTQSQDELELGKYMIFTKGHFFLDAIYKNCINRLMDAPVSIKSINTNFHNLIADSYIRVIRVRSVKHCKYC